MKNAGWFLAVALLAAVTEAGCCAGHHPCCASGGSAAAAGSKGIIWLNHHDLVLDNSGRYTLSNNGTDVFIDTTPGVVTFPDRELVPIYVPTLPPGYNVTGMRVCYGIVGKSPDTKVHRLRLSQFNSTGTGGTTWPGYIVRMEDLNAGNTAPSPAPGGFKYGDGKGFVCVDSPSGAGAPCLDPGKGTIAADTGVQIGGTGERIVIEAIGVQYDSTCTPN